MTDQKLAAGDADALPLDPLKEANSEKARVRAELLRQLGNSQANHTEACGRETTLRQLLHTAETEVAATRDRIRALREQWLGEAEREYHANFCEINGTVHALRTCAHELAALLREDQEPK